MAARDSTADRAKDVAVLGCASAAHGGVGDEWISLTFAMLTVAFWIAVVGVLYRQGVRIQV